MVNFPNVEEPVSVMRLPFAATLPTKLTLLVTPVVPVVKLELRNVRFVVPVSPSSAVQATLVVRSPLVKQILKPNCWTSPLVRATKKLVLAHVSKKFVTVPDRVQRDEIGADDLALAVEEPVSAMSAAIDQPVVASAVFSDGAGGPFDESAAKKVRERIAGVAPAGAIPPSAGGDAAGTGVARLDEEAFKGRETAVGISIIGEVQEDDRILARTAENTIPLADRGDRHDGRVGCPCAERQESRGRHSDEAAGMFCKDCFHINISHASVVTYCCVA